MENSNLNVSLADSRKSLSIAGGWNYTREVAEGKDKPLMEFTIDKALLLKITLAPQGKLTVWANKNRRPESQDPEYRMTVSLPSEIVDAEIARQRALREQVEAEMSAQTVH